MEIIDTIKYFAKFPQRSGVLKCFSDNTPSIPGYTDLKSYMTALPENGLIPDIKNFIVSIDEKKISEQIRTMEGYFLYLEYAGFIGSALDPYRNRDITSKWAIIIGYNWNGKNTDSMGESLIMDSMTGLVKQIALQIKTDDKLKCASDRLMDNGFNLTPIPPYLLYQNHGWELSFTKQNNFLL